MSTSFKVLTTVLLLLCIGLSAALAIGNLVDSTGDQTNPSDAMLAEPTMSVEASGPPSRIAWVLYAFCQTLTILILGALKRVALIDFDNIITITI